MMRNGLHTLAALAAVAVMAACGAKTEGGDANTEDSTAVAPSATTTPAAPMAGDSAAAGGAPYVVENGGAVTPANGSGQMAPGDTAYGNTAPAGPSGPGGQDTLVTKSKTTP